MLILVDLHVKFGSESQIIFKGEIFLFLEIECLHLDRHRLAENIELIVIDIFHDSLKHVVIDHIACDISPETAMQIGDGYVSFAETRNLMGPADLLELLDNGILVIVLFDIHRQACADSVSLLHGYVHKSTLCM